MLRDKKKCCINQIIINKGILKFAIDFIDVITNFYFGILNMVGLSVFEDNF